MSEPVEQCNQCGFDCIEFDQGVCVECSNENQQNLDDHNFHYARWERMKDNERRNEIRRATA